MDRITIYFDEALHKYTDEFGNVYTSATTLVGKYIKEFDVDAVARRCAMAGLRGNPKYAGKTAAQLKREWAENTKSACEKGSTKHNYLEDVVKNCNGYNRNYKDKFTNGRLYTILDIIEDDRIGRIYLEDLIETGIDTKYPKIFKVLTTLINKGYRLFSEVGVYNNRYLISGLIDLFALSEDNTKFIIVDWKTNKAPIRFDAGYHENGADGKLTGKYINTNAKFLYPVSHLDDSIGNHYTMQLSIYDYLASGYGLQFEGNILCHIRDVEGPFGDITEEINLLPIKYLRNEVHSLFEDNLKKNGKSQCKLQL